MNYVFNTGDIIKARIKEYPMFFHLGIVVVRSDGIFVYHNAPPENGINANGGSVLVEPFEKWIETRELVNIEPADITEQQIKEAAAKLSHKKYDLYFFNCEHFVNFVKNEMWQSYQLETAILITTIIAIATSFFITSKNKHNGKKSS